MAIAQTESQNDAGRDKPIVPEETYRSTHVWPVVQFEGGRTLLCIPSTFDVNNVDGQMEARREQVCILWNPCRGQSSFFNSDSSDLSLGTQHPQVSGADSPASTSESKSHI